MLYYTVNILFILPLDQFPTYDFFPQFVGHIFIYHRQYSILWTGVSTFGFWLLSIFFSVIPNCNEAPKLLHHSMVVCVRFLPVISGFSTFFSVLHYICCYSCHWLCIFQEVVLSAVCNNWPVLYFLLLAHYIPNVAKRSIWHQCNIEDQRSTNDRPLFLEVPSWKNFKRPYLRNGARWMHGHCGPPIGSRPSGVEWSRDR